jgi:hypothetical protein
MAFRTCRSPTTPTSRCTTRVPFCQKMASASNTSAMSCRTVRRVCASTTAKSGRGTPRPRTLKVEIAALGGVTCADCRERHDSCNGGAAVVGSIWVCDHPGANPQGGPGRFRPAIPNRSIRTHSSRALPNGREDGFQYRCCTRQRWNFSFSVELEATNRMKSGRAALACNVLNWSLKLGVA